jgi:hypothetical protein
MPLGCGGCGIGRIFMENYVPGFVIHMVLVIFAIPFWE